MREIVNVSISYSLNEKHVIHISLPNELHVFIGGLFYINRLLNQKYLSTIFTNIFLK
ncbi:hypothetical protein IGL02_002590 [Enterococcus sp. DIV1217]